MSAGLFIEPLIHPKPGAVTRLLSHPDKNVVDFAYNNTIVLVPLFDACTNAYHGNLRCIYGNAFHTISVLYSRLMEANTSMGSWLLHLPLAVALGYHGALPPERLAKEASALLKRFSSGCDTFWYYRLLSVIKPSHLGKLESNMPDASTGIGATDVELVEVVDYAASSDIVHRELLNGYKESVKWFTRLKELTLRVSLEEAASEVFLEMLASTADTLIRRKYGTRASTRVREYARSTLKGISTVDELDEYMRSRGFNAGSLLDILSVALSFYVYERVLSVI